MERHVTPEEKLLKLIRKKDDVPRGKNEVTLKNSGSNDSKRKKFDIIEFSNRLLIFIILGLGILIVLQYLKAGLMTTPTKTAGIKEGTPIDDGELVPSFKSFSRYQTAFEETEVFIAPWEKDRKSLTTPIEAPQLDLSKVLRVAGILLDDDPKAIIEDAKTKQTHFISVGESVSGARLTAIMEDKVTFEYQGESVDILPRLGK